ncbi:MAG TPA: PEP-CTERM sorting domain-containing protein, partial [Chthoniobacterales bacterium]|nr:PEP-CTERM sorting domain-containing protein [Chthoniobacterales bacterium]
GSIGGAFKLTKGGPGLGTLILDAANTYNGGTFLSSGILIANKDGALGTGNVSLTAGFVTLTLQNGAINNYIADSATLSYVSTDIINLTYTGTDIVTGLTVDGVAQAAGVYGATAINPDGVFTGSGTITVVPEPTTVAMMVLGGSLLVGMQRFRRKLR